MNTQQEAGQKLRRARERLGLKYRDVRESSQRLAQTYSNSEFQIGLSRLADIETKGTVPSLFRLYSLCVIYKLNFTVVLRWYGIKLDDLSLDAARVGLQNTIAFDLDISDSLEIDVPHSLTSTFDFTRTTFLGEQIHQWGIVSIALLKRMNVRKGRFGFVGTEDWSMWPLIPPGSFLQIDERKTKPETDEWQSEFDRQIYLVEHRGGFHCGWCSQSDDRLIIQSHPSSQQPPTVYRYPGEVDIVGQVVGVAMRMGQAKQRRTRF